MEVKLVPLVEHLRERYLSRHHFSECIILRGIAGKMRPLQGYDDTAVAVMWKKKGSYELVIVMIDVLCTLSNFDPRELTIVIYTED